MPSRRWPTRSTRSRRIWACRGPCGARLRLQRDSRCRGLGVHVAGFRSRHRVADLRAAGRPCPHGRGARSSRCGSMPTGGSISRHARCGVRAAASCTSAIRTTRPSTSARGRGRARRSSTACASIRQHDRARRRGVPRLRGVAGVRDRHSACDRRPARDRDAHVFEDSRHGRPADRAMPWGSRPPSQRLRPWLGGMTMSVLSAAAARARWPTARTSPASASLNARSEGVHARRVWRAPAARRTRPTRTSSWWTWAATAEPSPPLRARDVRVGRPFPPLDHYARITLGTLDEMTRATAVSPRSSPCRPDVTARWPRSRLAR